MFGCSGVRVLGIGLPFAQEDEVVIKLVEVVRTLGTGLDCELVPHLVRGRVRVRVRGRVRVRVRGRVRVRVRTASLFHTWLGLGVGVGEGVGVG